MEANLQIELKPNCRIQTLFINGIPVMSNAYNSHEATVCRSFIESKEYSDDFKRTYILSAYEYLDNLPENKIKKEYSPIITVIIPIKVSDYDGSLIRTLDLKGVLDES